VPTSSVRPAVGPAVDQSSANTPRASETPPQGSRHRGGNSSRWHSGQGPEAGGDCIRESVATRGWCGRIVQDRPGTSRERAVEAPDILERPPNSRQARVSGGFPRWRSTRRTRGAAVDRPPSGQSQRPPSAAGYPRRHRASQRREESAREPEGEAWAETPGRPRPKGPGRVAAAEARDPRSSRPSGAKSGRLRAPRARRRTPARPPEPADCWRA